MSRFATERDTSVYVSEALEGFKGVVRMEAEGGGKGEWGFKALKQVVKIRFRMGQSKEMLADYRCALNRSLMCRCLLLACVRQLAADMRANALYSVRREARTLRY